MSKLMAHCAEAREIRPIAACFGVGVKWVGECVLTGSYEWLSGPLARCTRDCIGYEDLEEVWYDGCCIMEVGRGFSIQDIGYWNMKDIYS